MKKKISTKVILNILLVIFLVSLFAYLCFSDNGLIDLIRKSKGFNKPWLGMAFLCHLINIFIDIYLVYKFIPVWAILSYSSIELSNNSCFGVKFCDISDLARNTLVFG